MSLENFLDSIIINYNQLGGSSLKFVKNDYEYSSGIFFNVERKRDFLFKTVSIFTAPLIHFSYMISEACFAFIFSLTALGNLALGQKQNYFDDTDWAKECAKSAAFNFIAIFLSSLINLIDLVLTILNSNSIAHNNNSSEIPIGI